MIALPTYSTPYPETLALDEELRLNPKSRQHSARPPAVPAPTWHLPLLEREPDLDWRRVPTHVPSRPDDAGCALVWCEAGCWAHLEPELERAPLTLDPLVWGWRLAGWRLSAGGVDSLQRGTARAVQVACGVYESPLEALEAALRAMRRHAAELVAAANPPAPSPEAGLPLFGGRR